jgi:hypothetical protein
MGLENLELRCLAGFGHLFLGDLLWSDVKHSLSVVEVR